MSKELYIIRHAKSDWSFELRDFDRPLSSRGFADAPVMAARVRENHPHIGCLVSSPAKRAITTAQIFAEVLGVPIKDIQIADRIYEASVSDLLGVINGLDDSLSTVAMFGHNPGFSALASYLSGSDIYNIPTCGIVHLQFDDCDSWTEISRETGQALSFIFPKDGE